MSPRTMFDKIWDAHVVAEGPGGQTLLFIDRHLLHEGSTHAFDRLQAAGRAMRRPDLSLATADHYLPTTPPSAGVPDAEVRGMLASLARHRGDRGITYFGPGDARRGIVHIIGPEQGVTQPGITLVCGDSHTATHGALGALAFGIGSSFGDIFHESAFKNGLLPVRLSADVIADIRRQLHSSPGVTMTVDLDAQTVTAPDGAVHNFAIDPFRKHALLTGQDEIALTLAHAPAIAAFESRRRTEVPWLFT